MGLTTTKLTLSNPRLPQLPRLETEALVDPGTLHLCVPAHVADALQLQTLEIRTVETADGGSHRAAYVGPVQVQLDGHGCFVGALVLGNQVLLGAVPMEDMNVMLCPS